MDMNKCTVGLSKRVKKLQSDILRDNEDIVADSISIPQVRLVNDIIAGSKDCKSLETAVGNFEDMQEGIRDTLWSYENRVNPDN